jgi:hypothetical protein
LSNQQGGRPSCRDQESQDFVSPHPETLFNDLPLSTSITVPLLKDYLQGQLSLIIYQFTLLKRSTGGKTPTLNKTG